MGGGGGGRGRCGRPLKTNAGGVGGRGGTEGQALCRGGRPSPQHDKWSTRQPRAVHSRSRAGSGGEGGVEGESRAVQWLEHRPSGSAVPP